MAGKEIRTEMCCVHSNMPSTSTQFDNTYNVEHYNQNDVTVPTNSGPSNTFLSNWADAPEFIPSQEYPPIQLIPQDAQQISINPVVAQLEPPGNFEWIPGANFQPAPQPQPTWNWIPNRPTFETRQCTPPQPPQPPDFRFQEMFQLISELETPTIFNIGIPLEQENDTQAGPHTYAEVLSKPEGESRNGNKEKETLCPYTTRAGICMNLTACPYRHPELCDMCGLHTLNPFDEEERKRHQQECLKQHEKNMELSFAIARSKEKSCGVCFEVIMEKANGEQRFGILPNCNHCFCLSCIRKWRQARQFENKIIRACPECRVTSDFVCPSMYWVDTKEDKDKLIDEYKKALSRKDCKYFKKGEGKCPFGNKCFYLHAAPDGKKVDVGPPPRQRRHRNVDADMEVLQVMLWDFLDERDFPWQSLADELEDLAAFFSDSEESDWSDYDYNVFVD